MIANLKLIRDKKGLSQQALADKLGISQQSIYKYETQETEPDFKMLIKIADYFEVSVDFLIGHTIKEDANADESALISKYRLLTQNEKQSIQMVIDNYLK